MQPLTLASLSDHETENDNEFFPEPQRLLTGEFLIACRDITPDQLHVALHEQSRTSEMIGEVLVRLGFIDENKLAQILAARAGIRAADLVDSFPEAALFENFTLEMATRYLTLPLMHEENRLHVALADPFDVMALDEVRRAFPRGTRVIPYAASKTAILEKLALLKDTDESLEQILRAIETAAHSDDSEAYTHPVIRLANYILQDAVQRGASDIHLEPEENFVRMRYRLDGLLQQRHALHLTHWPALSHRIKIIAGMNIADTRSIQDGRFQMDMGGYDVDFRVAIMPSSWGETIVIRILDHKRSLLPLEKLGYSATNLARLNEIIKKPQGITLVTGPTGSGKTTTLYSLLQRLSTQEVHIATLEDPIEFQLDLIRQTSVQEMQGLSFAAGVRGLLRMDPDIILIGEVRDPDTAQMTLRAAMTGHQLYSTLHCNDVFGALPRLVDLGLSTRVMAGNISGLIAQRLVRKLCPHCKQTRKASPEEARELLCKPHVIPTISFAKGCEACHGTGRKGRTVIAEVLSFSPEIDDLIYRDAPRAQILSVARQQGFITMQEDGMAKVLAGEIDLGDLRRAVDLSRVRPVESEIIKEKLR